MNQTNKLIYIFCWNFFKNWNCFGIFFHFIIAQINFIFYINFSEIKWTICLTFSFVFIDIFTKQKCFLISNLKMLKIIIRSMKRLSNISNWNPYFCFWKLICLIKSITIIDYNLKIVIRCNWFWSKCQLRQ